MIVIKTDSCPQSTMWDMDTCSKEKSKTEGLMDGKFNMFMETVDERFRSFVSQINEYLWSYRQLPKTDISIFIGI